MAGGGAQGEEKKRGGQNAKKGVKISEKRKKRGMEGKSGNKMGVRMTKGGQCKRRGSECEETVKM